jgi:hypothetical protein
MVAAGGCLICFAAPDTLAWLPGGFVTRKGAAREVVVEADTPFAGVLEKYAESLHYTCQLEHPAGNWMALASGRNGYPVAGWASYGKGAVIVPCQSTRTESLLRDLVRELAKFVPLLNSASSRRQTEQQPDCLADHPAGRRNLAANRQS